ncbi:MAG: antibiotic biosynthesis monooxygenase, partial [Cellvibrio sp.]
MYTSTFIFAAGKYDDEFYKLDEQIAEVARNVPGYLGEESWESPTTGRISNVYYWENMAALQALIKHPKHIEAKEKQSKWLNGYQVIIAQVVRAYGDKTFEHPV